MRLVWSARAWNDYVHWQQTDTTIVQRINALIKDTTRGPFDGIGKPEPLKREFKGWWSRRITGSDRLIYRVEGKGDDRFLEIASCRWHYER